MSYSKEIGETLKQKLTLSYLTLGCLAWCMRQVKLGWDHVGRMAPRLHGVYMRQRWKSNNHWCSWGESTSLRHIGIRERQRTPHDRTMAMAAAYAAGSDYGCGGSKNARESEYGGNIVREYTLEYDAGNRNTRWQHRSWVHAKIQRRQAAI
jgi:hypothetical protein